MWYLFFMENLTDTVKEEITQEEAAAPAPEKPVSVARGAFRAFIIAFLIFAAVAIPSLVMTKGVWIYYGDFNVQQIPFYNHLHSALRSGKYLYDWGTDLGGSYVGCYSFYILGSPFFWLTLLFSDGAIPYIMAWVTALKYAVMATTAYVFMRRHLRTHMGALLGSLMFAFAGYQEIERPSPLSGFPEGEDDVAIRLGSSRLKIPSVPPVLT